MKASVIIPAYNAEKTIGQCLEALQKQSFRDFEVVVVDDGSRDSTAGIVKRFQKVKLVRQENAGPAAARNRGAEIAKGEFLVFLDSDCVPDSEWLGQMLSPFRDTEIAGVQGRYRNAQQELVARFGHLEIEERYAKMARHRFIDFIGSYSAAYRKSVFEEMRGFDTSFPMASGEDTDLSFRISEMGYKMVFNPKATVFHVHPVSLWKYLKVKFFRALWRTKIYKKHKKKMLRDAYTSQTVKVQTGLFYVIVLSLALIPFGFDGAYYAAMALLALFLTTLKFAVWAANKDLAVAAVSPFLIIARTAVFGLGWALGIANHLRRSI